ncbi:MAG: SIS domain-containing protein [Bdellovibrionales bacterium]|nr:SIS domain-containing protein [Bdellovibrionales bacterium]
MENVIRKMLSDSASLKQKVAEDQAAHKQLTEIASKLIQVVSTGGTIYACGNGGSACDAMHFVEELTARYKRERDGVRAMHFMDGGMLTCWANDYDYSSAFERNVQTFCGPQDALIAISTSGNSENVLKAVRAAKVKQCTTIGLTGKTGGTLKDLADYCMIVPHQETDRIQEVHILYIHILCELIETELADLLNVKVSD